MKDLNDIVSEAVSRTLFDSGLSKSRPVSRVKIQEKKNLSEAYVTQSGKFDLQTELLSSKTKKAHQELLEGYVKELNNIAVKLDAVDKTSANLNNSQFRSLKIDETYNHNAAFLHGLYFQNISDLNSNISMDSLSYMRIARDFGTFDDWQEDFVACCLSARNGWAMTVYNMNLKRYINTVVDLHSDAVLINCIPIVVMDCWEHSYYKDYLKNRKAYVFAMMKELSWDVIEERIKKAEKIAKIL
jgi:superoxide dismutase, Fe-Mn family